jgi:hypothetical protein
MKNVALIILACASLSIATAQKMKEKNVPQEVVKSFKQNFKETKSVYWEKEKEHYEVEFATNTTEQSVLFDAKGNILETEVEIETNQLPKNVLTYIQTNYPSKKIKEAAKITDDKNQITYEAEVDGQDLLFDANGKFLKAVKN